MVRLHLLGSAAVSGGVRDSPEVLLTQPKRLAVLAYLVLARPRGPHRRDTLLALFWPELDQRRGRAALRQTLYVLRQVLGDEVIVSRGDDEVGVDPGRIWCDVVAFDTALKEGDVEQALTLYRGDLLPGHHVPGTANELEEWLFAEKTRLRRAAADGARHLAMAAEEEGDMRRALRWARREGELAPRDEGALRHRLALLDRCGDRAGAMAAYEAFALRLKQELDVDPSPETEALVRGIRERQVEASGGLAGRASAAVAQGAEEPAVTGGQRERGGAPDPPPASFRQQRAPLAIRATGLGFLLAAALLFAWRSGADGGLEPPVGPPSIAVLPLSHAEDGDAYFSDGVAEDILTMLSRVDELRVMSWTAVLPFREPGRTPREIGRELGVDHLVEVSARRAGDEIRVGVRLVHAGSGETIWAERYDERLGNLFTVESDIAERVATALRARLSPPARRAIVGAPTGDMAAYDLLLRGRELHHRHRREENDLAVAFFREAIELDPSFALAHAWLARSYAAKRIRFGQDNVWLDSAEVAARRALELDPDLPDAYRQLAAVRVFRGRPGEALPFLETAVRLDPGSTETMNSLGLANHLLGRTDEGVRWLRRATEGDSLTAAVARVNLAALYLQLGLGEHARETVDRSIAARPDFWIGHVVRGWVELLHGDGEEAVRGALRIAEQNPENARALLAAAEILVVAGEGERALPFLERSLALAPFVDNAIHGTHVLLAHLFLARGDRTRALELLDEFEAHAGSELAQGSGSGRLHYDLAAMHALRGETAMALDHLDRSIRAGWRYHPIVGLDPLLEPLHGEPRYREIMTRFTSQIEAMRRRVEAEEV